MSQPIWKFVAQLGDASPIEHGGYFLFEDTTGVYGFEAERLERTTDGESDEEEEEEDTDRWTVHRVCLDKLKVVSVSDENVTSTYLVPLAYATDWPSPVASYVEWFAKDLGKVAESMGTTREELVSALCSDDGKSRAFAYQCIGDYHGWENLDGYPLTLTRAEVEERYKDVI